MNYQSDIIIGLQNFNEGKTKQLNRLLGENYYDLCIKINGGTENSLFKFRNEFIHLKEIPYSILMDVDTLISDSCIINYDNLKEDINKLNELNISLKKLHISNNAIITTNKNNSYSSFREKNKHDIKKKVINECLKVKDITFMEYYYLFLHNSIKRVNTFEFLKKYKKIIVYQFLSFNNDIDYGSYYLNSCFHCSSSFCTNTINYKTISNIYGVSSLYEIFDDGKMHNKELDKIKNLEGFNKYLDWLNLDILIDNININNVNMVLFTKSDILLFLDVFKLYHRKKLISFHSLEAFKIYLKEQINLKCDVSNINFIFNY